MSGKVFEILHDTGSHIASFDEYNEKSVNFKVPRGVWGWKEDDDRIGSHPESARMDGASFVKYPADVSDSIERLFESWTQGSLGSTVDVNLKGIVQKLHGKRTGLAYEIDFGAMTQTNKNSLFKRAICREERCDATNAPAINLPPVPWRKSSPWVFLPTFSGQFIHVTKTLGHKNWYYGKILHTSVASNGPNEGWFPAVLCKKADNMALAKAMTTTKCSPMWPPNWEPGTTGRLPVRVSSSEYRDVETAFASSMNRSCKIVNIERIQSLEQWKLYAVKAESLRSKYKEKPASLINNKSDNLEMRWLFHGTDGVTVPKIINQGFNRAFAGRNATAYGKGCYFALEANYSEQFAVPDTGGVQRMFLCRVLVGDYCQGKNNQLTPDSKPGGINELFDSTVDDITDPEIFVVYHDSQAYPEYLVTFQ